jgi:hypothetical protein
MVFAFGGSLLEVIDMKEPRPTEYMGKVFKSKTEAMYALLMDIKSLEVNRRQRVLYEPEKYKTPSGYIPDFEKAEIDAPFLADFITLIEVKPSIPNKTYMEYLTRQFAWIKQNDKFHFISFMAIYVFNPYDRVILYDLFNFETLTFSGDFEKPAWFKDEYFDSVLRFRFDL